MTSVTPEEWTAKSVSLVPPERSAAKSKAQGILVPLGLLALAAACAHSAPPRVRPESDETVVYLAAKVRTLDPARPVAQALSTRRGRVLAVGTRAQVLASAGDAARVVDLGSATLVPGLTDGHGHLALPGRTLSMVRLEGAKSAAEAVERLTQAGEGSRQGEWLLGAGWDQNDWPGKQWPTRAELDARFPDVPVVLTRVDYHAAWVSSAALRKAGITRKTEDPSGGRILRDERGEPTGVLVDSAVALVEEAMPGATKEQLEQRLKVALERCAEAGLTGVHDAGMDLATFGVLQAWDVAGWLPLRVYAMADGQGADAQIFLEQGPYRGRMLTLRAVKLILDGALGSRGAALHAPYSDEPTQRGHLLLSEAELEAKAKAFMARGFQVAVHAIGDRANTVALEVLGRAAEATGTRAGRHRIEHAQVVRPEDFPLFNRYGLIASVQPTHATSDMGWVESRLGEKRAQGAYAWRALASAGAKLVLGSDFPVESPDVLAGLHAARARQDAKGKPEGGWYPKQRLTAQEALHGFTTGAAWASFSEEQGGRLSAGRDADFVALSVDPLEVMAPALLQARVLATVSAGREIYRARSGLTVSQEPRRPAPAFAVSLTPR